jgi:hypothetical protein
MHRLFPLLALCLWLLAPAPARAAGLLDPKVVGQFSADFAAKTGQMVMTGKYYKDGDRMRLEPTGMSGMNGQTMPGMAMIVDLETQQVMTIMPAQKMVMVMPIGSPMARVPKNPMDEAGSIVSTKTIGKETVSGHPTTVEEVVVKDSKGQTHTLKVWSATDLDGFPMQVQSRDPKTGTEVTFTYSNVKLGAPDRSLFQVPADYQKMDMGAMQRGMMQPGMMPQGGQPMMPQGGQPMMPQGGQPGMVPQGEQPAH